MTRLGQFDPFDPILVAADYVLAGVRGDDSRRLLVELLAGAGDSDLRTLAFAIAYLAELPEPK